jgi:hypothetical protein
MEELDCAKNILNISRQKISQQAKLLVDFLQRPRKICVAEYVTHFLVGSQWEKKQNTGAREE